MTSEQFVKDKYPRAKVDVYHNRDGSKHWICWSTRLSRTQIRLSTSIKSKNSAWVEARKNMESKLF